MKRFFVFTLIFFILFIVSCESGSNKSTTDETTNTLSVYVWMSSKTEFFTADEIETIKKAYKRENKDVVTSWHLIQNCTKQEFGKKVNDANDADVILSAVNMDSADGSNIKIKTSETAQKTLINASWCSTDERYIGIAENCSNVHFQNALAFRTLLTNEKPELYKHQNVLFLGNSYTFYNDQYKVFKGICENQGMSIDVQTVVKSSTSLANLLDETSEEHKKLISKLQVTEFNYIIMQEQSTKPIFAFEAFEVDVSKLITLIKHYNPNAKICLFETWARQVGSSFYTENPTYTYKTAEKALLDGYKTVANKYDLMISYAGVGFYLAQVNNVNVNLYQSDLTHPSSTGTYLAALIHAGTLFGINPKEVTYVPSFVIEASGGNRIQPTTEDCAAVRNVAYDVIYNLDLSILD